MHPAYMKTEGSEYCGDNSEYIENRIFGARTSMFLQNSTSKLNVVTKDTNAIGYQSKLKSANNPITQVVFVVAA